jgi:hypothetical protein
LTGRTDQVPAIERHVLKRLQNFGFGAQFSGARFARLG